MESDFHESKTKSEKAIAGVFFMKLHGDYIIMNVLQIGAIEKYT